MPYKELMSWEGDPAFRWRKTKKGIVYRITCEELGIPRANWSKEASREAANDWWERQFAQIVVQTNRPNQAPLNVGKPLVIEGWVSIDPSTQQLIFARIADAVGDVETASRLKPPAKNLGAYIQDFLMLKRQKAPKTYLQIKTYLNELNDLKHDGKTIFHQAQDPKTIDEERIRQYYAWIRSQNIAPTSKRTRQVRFKEFIRWLWREKAIADIPRNLDAKEHAFSVPVKQIKKHDLKEVAEFLNTINERFALYALLSLNCGMLPGDIASMTHDQLDFEKAMLIRKRVKLKDQKNAPIVTYRLWEETITLLKKHRSKHATLALTNTDGNPLETKEILPDGQTKISNRICQQWFKRKFPFKLKDFRSIGASLVRSHPTLSHLATYYLANTPSGITEKHYAAESDEQFFILLDWMREKIFNG